MKLEESQGREDTERIGEKKQEEMLLNFTAYMLDVIKNEIKNIETDLVKNSMNILLCLKEKQNGKVENYQQGEEEWRGEKNVPFAMGVGKVHSGRGWSFRERVRQLRAPGKTYPGSSQCPKKKRHRERKVALHELEFRKADRLKR